jgi:hypothetical protein
MSYFANQALNLSFSSSPLSDQNSAFSKTAVLKLFGAVGICGIILIPAVAWVEISLIEDLRVGP